MPSAFVGLCANCSFSRTVNSGRSTFYLCERALTDPGFRKYPPLPVLSCSGYEWKGTADPPADAKPGDKLTG